MSARPTGRLVRREDGLYLQLDRLFSASIEDVWRSLTNPEAMSHWIGTYTGNPRTGAVKAKLSPSPHADWEYATVMEWDPPHRLQFDLGDGEYQRRVFCHLSEGGGHTTLTMGQRLHSPVEAGVVGPTLDFYLDRLTAYRNQEPLPSYDAYFSPYSLFYRELMVPPKSA